MKEKVVADLESMTDRELLEELVERIVAYEGSQLELHDYERKHGGAESLYDDERYSELSMEADEDFCRVREVVRLVKNDPEFWLC